MTNANAYIPLFNRAVEFVLSMEGGYVNNPKDPGGETKYGISKRQYPHLDIFNLTREQAIDIYYQDYWLANKCNALPPRIAIAFFGAHVNHRPKTANRLIQLAARVKADGIVGPVTLKAIAAADQEALLVRFLANRAKLYHRITLANSDNAQFILGWFTRLFKLQSFLMRIPQ